MNITSSVGSSGRTDSPPSQPNSPPFVVFVTYTRHSRRADSMFRLIKPPISRARTHTHTPTHTHTTTHIKSMILGCVCCYRQYGCNITNGTQCCLKDVDEHMYVAPHFTRSAFVRPPCPPASNSAPNIRSLSPPPLAWRCGIVLLYCQLDLSWPVRCLYLTVHTQRP